MRHETKEMIVEVVGGSVVLAGICALLYVMLLVGAML
jgi:hypothetical protein